MLYVKKRRVLQKYALTGKDYELSDMNFTVNVLYYTAQQKIPYFVITS